VSTSRRFSTLRPVWPDRPRGGQTWLRHNGRIAYAVLTEELFDTLRPDPQRAWSVDEMPYRYDELLLRGLAAALSDEKDE
jgi:hypothetical protein